MQATFPNPVGDEVIMYHYEGDFPQLTSMYLERILQPIKRDLDLLTLWIPHSDVELLRCHMFFQRKGEPQEFLYIDRAFDCTIDEGLRFSLPSLRNDYASEFKKAIDSFPLEPTPANLYIDISCYTDKEPVKLDVFTP